MCRKKIMRYHNSLCALGTEPIDACLVYKLGGICTRVLVLGYVNTAVEKPARHRCNTMCASNAVGLNLHTGGLSLYMVTRGLRPVEVPGDVYDEARVFRTGPNSYSVCQRSEAASSYQRSFRILDYPESASILVLILDTTIEEN
ncbi:hypothetical protein VTI74DRAFT_264 [Chaetomium olivicolor]